MYLADGTLILSPTDLVAFSGCAHRTHLDWLVAHGELAPPPGPDAFTEVLRDHGGRHERRTLDEMRRAGVRLVEIPHPHTTAELEAAAAQTLDAMREGIQVVYQGAFFDGRWRGHADFLVRVDTPSDLGPWGYEAHDTKLARHTTAGALIQLAEYSRHIARLQGVAPARLHVVLGDGRSESFVYAEVAAYVDAVRERFEEAVAVRPAGTVADPVTACAMCDWEPRCKAEWRAADHLSLVAGIRRDQRAHLAAAGVATRIALAELAPGTEVPELRAPVTAVLHEQAALQVRSERGGEIAWNLIEPDPNAPHAGLAALPAPSAGDVFFDMEGDGFVGTEGIEYLFGWVEGAGADARFQTLWAHDPVAEKQAFEGFIDAVMARRAADPSMHVYHYAAYETSALKRLMGRYATREEELDTLLRGEVFVDLHRVVRQGVRIGTESYSLKAIEPLYAAARTETITDAATSVVQYEEWLGSQDARILEEIASYNETDCRSLVGLRAWLEARRGELEGRVGPLPRLPPATGAPSEAVSEQAVEVSALEAELMEGVPADPDARTGEQRAVSLLASLLDWHRRDAKPGWWEYFSRLNAPLDQLMDDSGAVAGLQYDDELEKPPGAKRRRFRFTFPAQETKVRAGRTALDPRTVLDDEGRKAPRSLGKIEDIDTEAGWLVLNMNELPDPPPEALFTNEYVPVGVMRDALLRLGRWVSDHGIDAPGPHRAIRDLLLRRPPRLRTGAAAALRLPDEPADRAAVRCVLDLDHGCLPIQGPPGSGKTRTAVHAILALLDGRRGEPVAVTALSHRAITHLLTCLCAEATARGRRIRVVQRVDGEQGCAADQVRCVGSPDDVRAALDEGTVDVVAGTAWLFARPNMESAFRTLFVDEAGQLSLAMVASMAGCAQDLVLLGDPQQLQQPSAATHPPGAGASALRHALGAHETIPGDRGIFLEESWRMHPDICTYISRCFYESRLHAAPRTRGQRILGDDGLAGTGLRWLPVDHTGDRSSSLAEAEATAAIVARLLGRRWVDAHGDERPLGTRDILVVAPYNAHVDLLRRHLPDGVAVGTVDRFQGQEAAVVVYSMATSHAEDVPRGIDFLYSRNRTNVAVSRAQCLTVLVCSPALTRVFCTSARTIPMVSALCDFVSSAGRLDVQAPVGQLSLLAAWSG